MAEAHSNNQKDTVYIDIDDEITAVIDKVHSGKHKIVALVLPKRATVLQSIVNMKLLKRTGEETKKRIVLITSEAGLLPLAGAVGLHVAKTLQSKPEIPEAPKVPSADVALDEPDELDDEEPSIDASESVGSLSDKKKSRSDRAKPAPEETIELDEEDIDQETTDTPKPKKTDKKGDKKLKIPDFNSFRKKLLLGGAAFVLLIILWYVGFFVVPKASIVVKTDSLTSDVDVNFSVNTATKSFDEKLGIIPATLKEVKKTDNVKVSATGKKNVGDKAKGSVSLQNCTKTDGSVTVPAGTTVNNAGFAFITDVDLTLSESSFTGSGKCTSGDKEVAVTAANSGDQYNLSGGRNFSVSGYSGINGTDSSAMSGGTTKNVSVVSDQDIATAKQQLADKSKAVAQAELSKVFKDEKLLALAETTSSADPVVTSTPKVGEEASDVTVTSITTYTMLGIKQDNLKKLVTNAAKKDIDTDKQAINDDGLDKAVFRQVNKVSANEQKLSVQTTVSTGVSVNEDELKTQIAGKKKGDVQSTIGALPGVKDVQVKYSPFWISVTPKKASKITIEFEKL